MTNEYDARQIAKIDLWKYSDAKKSIRDMKNKIDTLTSRINSSTSRMKEISIQSSKQSKEELIDNLIDLRDLYGKMQADAERTLLNIEIRIGEIEDGLHQRILRNHYLYGQRFEKISLSENLCYRTIKKCHQRALNDYVVVFMRMKPEEYQRIKAEEIREEA